ncbi:hypothetical protein E1A91_A04G006600v1 [Gossypium mustelinum]|uniref:Receptor-like protein 12 n=1 Tax=Gossypium mustelinum TaxID=34275 RepID=A0A5D2ZJ37_GOSMU|nr:hypothetical protein E1A91_A04G006600v1 [Gossypium mustelinum]
MQEVGNDSLWNLNVASLLCNATSLKILDLSHNNLSGTIPQCFGNLSYSLEFLNLKKNKFYGTIPPTFAQGCQLANLNLNGNLLEGPLTPSILNCKGLEVLDLGNNKINDTFPHWLGSLPQLQVLVLKSNHMHGSLRVNSSKSSPFFSKIQIFDLSREIPKVIGKLNLLKGLNLSHNNLNGGIPTSIGNLTNLSMKQLSGQIPRSLGNLLQLTHLDLSHNQLSGQVPLSILNLTRLEDLTIVENSLEGSIPDDVTAFPDLILLDLPNNLFNGTLPSWLYTAPTLKEIDLSQNQISGHIKEFQSKSLESIWLENNKLQGLLPSSIFQLLNLIGLSLSSNNLSGVIELSMFSNLPNLKYLDLSYNSLSLTSNSTSTVNLTSLLLSSCNLSEFPQFLKGLKSLEWLDLSYNRIEGKIPQWMQEVGIDSLRYLNISHNSLTEVEQFPWKNIAFLDLSSNLIRGNLPILASTINIFLISNNSFNGEVSSLICNASALQILDLSHNNLSGKIPQCFGNLSNSLEFLNLKKNKDKLSNFNLNGNLLEGPLTPSILNCKGLEVLNLGNNKINDTFPHWLGGLPQLQVLVLKSNHMHGSLCVNSSKSSPFFSKIQIFDLSSNYFSGPLPVRYINSFKAIINLEKIGSTVSYMGENDHGGRGFYTYSIGIVIKGQYMELVKIFNMWMIIDLSNNQFEGGIPKVIGKLNLLKGLNLSHNNLNGGIPTSIGNLTSLEWLDLSSNRLSGTIPNRLAELPFLSSLNVSENQLHGNKGLCGFPVSKGCNIIEPPPPNVLEKDGSKSNFAFGWKVALIGYGCGVVFGMFVGYVVFQTGKPKWLVNLVENQHEKRRKRKSKKGNRSNR